MFTRNPMAASQVPNRIGFLTFLLLGFSGATVALAQSGSEVGYNSQVRPILSDNCFRCHGFDKGSRKAGLRLDRAEGALESGAIVPGSLDESEIWRRITSDDPDERMPPPETGKSLSEEEISTIGDWIQEGAEYEAHWAYLPPERPDLPEVQNDSWPNNPIDYFILSSLEERGLAPSEPASDAGLARRLSFDLLGLPPTRDTIQAFAAAVDEAGRRAWVRETLADPAFGERMAMDWLDWVRYADTVGYHGDQDFSVSPYRDYVIDAFNDNKPFDVFTREQIVGDLLPGSGVEQKVASGYNRLLRITAEGGAQDKEYLAKYAADRVRTTASVWLGSTMGCAECHDHKFDPFSAADFYSMAAYFADLEEKGFYGGANSSGNWGPSIPVPSENEAAELARLESDVEALEAEWMAPNESWDAAQLAWESALEGNRVYSWGTWSYSGAIQATSFDEAFDRESVDVTALFDSGVPEAWVARPDWVDGEVHALAGDNTAHYLMRQVEATADGSLTLWIGSDDGARLWVNGERVLDQKVQRGVALDQDSVEVSLRAGSNTILFKIANGGGGAGFAFRAGDGIPEEIQRIASIEPAERNPEQRAQLRGYFRERAPQVAAFRDALSEAKEARDNFKKGIRTTLVSVSVEPRTMRVLRRGDWQDEGGEVVRPRPPEFMAETMRGSYGESRVDLANWLVAPDNPLTARVFVNRLWKRFFGQGLSAVLDDLGAQGSWPTHPELLDWLAVEFIESGWDIKHVVELIVSSAAYQQSADVRAELSEEDPFNRLFGRQARFRLPAEVVRDTALQVSGLLVSEVGGASVKPYQPRGYYAQLNFPRREYQADSGKDQYRRGVYMHWQRTFLHPMLAAFDASNREECVAQRPESNTPLQALVLLNDPSFVEAARALGERMLGEGGARPREQIAWGFETVTGRAALDEELTILLSLYTRRESDFEADPESARALLDTGLAPASDQWPLATRAAMASVGRALLNLSETITRY